MTGALEILEEDVRSVIAASGLNESVEVIAQTAIDSYRDRYLDGDRPPLPPNLDLVDHIVRRLSGFGPLHSLLCDDEVEEVWINGTEGVFAARRGEVERTDIELRQQQIEEVIERMLAASGRRVDRSSPFVDARLSDGSRLHVVIPPIATGWSVNIRRFVGIKNHDIRDLVRASSLDEPSAAFLEAAIRVGLNVVVAGAVGAGKTTLLNCLASAIPQKERVVTCEEVCELSIGLPDVVALQCRSANLEGEGEVDLRRLVKESLRMRPDRIVIGEVRGGETLDLLLAMNAGCAAMTSVHANSAKEALRKLTTLPLLAGENVTREFVEPTVASCVDLVIFCARDKSDGTRSVREILGVAEQVAATGISASPIFVRRGGSFEWTGEYPRASERFEAMGIDLSEVLAR